MSDSVLNEGVIQMAVAKVIFEGMTSEDRDKLVQSAVQQLLMPDDTRTSSYYGDTRSPIQRIFQDEVRVVAAKLFKEELEKPAEEGNLRWAIEGLVHKALSKMLANSSDEDGTSLIDQLAHVFARTLASTLAERS